MNHSVCGDGLQAFISKVEGKVTATLKERKPCCFGTVGTIFNVVGVVQTGTDPLVAAEYVGAWLHEAA